MLYFAGGHGLIAHVMAKALQNETLRRAGVVTKRA